MPTCITPNAACLRLMLCLAICTLMAHNAAVTVLDAVHAART